MQITDTLRRFVEARVEPVTESGCWIWTGPLDAYGYGQLPTKVMRERPPTRRAHRITWAIRHGGAVPDVLDHLCRVKCCVNPDHLEGVTPRENTMRSPVAPAAINALKTHCGRGHEFTQENTYFNPCRPRSRVCRICHRNNTLESQRARSDRQPRGPRGGRFRSECKWAQRLVAAK